MFSKKSIKKLRSLSAALGLAAVTLCGSVNSVKAEKLFDFQGNNRTSFATVGGAAGGPWVWRVTGNPASAAPNAAFKRDFNYGLSESDNIVVGDYTGDSKSEAVVFRTAEVSSPGVFYVAQFPTGTGGITLERAVQFGNAFTDTVATPGDYDGGGKTDYCVVRVSGGNLVWYIMSSETGTMKAIPFGTTTGVTGPSVFPGADFNGDGRDELIFVTRNAAGTIVNYFIGDANTGAGVITRSFGNYNADFSVAPDDYTGDGRADFIAVRQTQASQSIWYIQNSQTNAVTATAFGIADPTFGGAADVPVRGDYDGDNRHDICVWRASNQTFYYISSQNGSIQAQKSGEATDTPLGSFALY